MRQLRAYKSSDFDPVRTIYNESRAAERCFVQGPLGHHGFAALIRQESIHIFESEGQPVGFVSIYLPENFIHHLYVLPDFQGSGIAGDLIAECRVLYGLPLGLKCLVANEKACGFYEAHDWLRFATGTGRDGAYYHYILNEVF